MVGDALIYKDPVRSGIKIEHDGDVIITSFVSDNAEIVATGNIHVYGQVRGRLIAGSAGNRNTGIFVCQFNAQLVSIAGVYSTMDNRLPDSVFGSALMITLNDKGKLVINPLNILVSGKGAL